MKEIMKLIRFDYITSKNSALPFSCGMLIICIVLAVFGVFNPLFGVFLVLSFAAFFAPAMTAAQKPEFRRVRGILPVNRVSFVRAEFAEYMLGLLASEVITLLLMWISRLSRLYEIFPQKFEVLCKEIHNIKGLRAGDSYFKFVPLVILISVLLTVQVTFIAMRSDIEKGQHDIRNVLLVFSVAVIAFIVSIMLVSNRVIPPYEKWLFPSGDSSTLIWGTALNAAAVALGILFCRITEKKTADYEI